MARKVLEANKVTETFDSLIPQYYADNEAAKEYKKKADESNKKIKALFKSDDSTIVKSEKAKKDERSITVDEIKATYYIQERKSLNTEGTVEFLKAKGYTQAIKTVEVLDEDKLEQMAYDGTISQEDLGELSKFEMVKDVAMLTVKGVD